MLPRLSKTILNLSLTALELELRMEEVVEIIVRLNALIYQLICIQFWVVGKGLKLQRKCQEWPIVHLICARVVCLWAVICHSCMEIVWKTVIYINYYIWEFPCDPVVKPWCFYCHGAGSVPGLEIRILQAMWCSQKKKKKKSHYIVEKLSD